MSMRPITRSAVSVSIIRSPVREVTSVSLEEVARLAGIAPEALEGLVSLGIVESSAPPTGQFTIEEALKLKRILRLHRELDVDLVGSAIIADLLERLEALERTLSRLRSARNPGKES
jgi:hypothetical protein